MSLENAERLISLRAMAHPVRLRILSLATGAALSAAEIAEELGIAHAAASYHARQLADARLLQIETDERKQGGRGRPPVRYRYVAALSNRLDRSSGEAGAWVATFEDLQRRIRERTRVRVSADAEVWLTPVDFDEVCALAQQISDIIHGRAQRPHAEGTTHGSASVFAFELADDR